MKKGYIYKYTFPNGKVYIGQTSVSVKQRHLQHMSDSKNPNKRTICEVAIAKYGAPRLDIIETIEVDDNKITELIEKLSKAEKKWIKKYDSTNVTKGYNIQNGGEIKTPEEFILQEKWYEMFEKEEWGNLIAYYTELLRSIGNKICVTGEKLTQEERSCWYGYRFMDYEYGKETTFNSFYKRYLDSDMGDDIGDIPYETLEILYSNTSSPEEIETAEKESKLIHFDRIIRFAIDENWIKDIQQTIWRKIMKNKDKIIKEWYMSKI